MIVKNSFAAVRQALTIHLRDYQENLKNDIYAKWAQGFQNVLAVLPTGGGKTILFGRIVYDHNEPTCVIAHRKELVEQISCSLAAYGIKHKILADEKTRRAIVKQHIKKTGYNFEDPRSECVVASVGTLNSRKNKLKDWCSKVKRWVIDECHHVLRENQWGKAVSLFPNAKGLGVTATPERTDGKGLGRSAKGWFDCFCIGPALLDLIDMGYLTPYKIYAPPNDLDFSGLKRNIHGEIIDTKELTLRERNSSLVGDVVETFNRFCEGKNGITFASSRKVASIINGKFNDSGTRSAYLDGETESGLRTKVMEAFREQQYDQMINVDLFDEGLDVPNLHAVSMARKTGSFAKFNQQAGRTLRPVYQEGMPLETPEQRKAAIAAGPKPFAWIFDHVGNVVEHAVARTFKGERVVDICYRQWSLDGRSRIKRADKDPDITAVTTCESCYQDFDLSLLSCPHCGHQVKASERKDQTVIDGDLTLLSPDMVKQLHEEVYKIKTAKPVTRMGGGMAKHISEKQDAKREAQDTIHQVINWWGDQQTKLGRSKSEQYRRFYNTFGCDVLSAQLGSTKDMQKLANKIVIDIGELVLEGSANQ